MPADGATHVPADAGVPELAAAAAGCRACELWERGAQTVFGEGPDHSRLVLVGEQPGGEEDLRAIRSWGRRAGSSTRPWRPPASTGARRT